MMLRKALTFLLFFLLVACGREQQEKKSVMSEADLKKLQEMAREKDQEATLIAVTTPENQNEVKAAIEKNQGIILFQDEKTGIIHFRGKSDAALSFYYDSKEKLDVLTLDRLVKMKDEVAPLSEEEILGGTNTENLNDLYPTKLMKVDELQKLFKQKYGKELNGENATIAVFDTGIDMSRTDVFQDRLVYLKSLRQEDVALLTEAVEETIDGVEFITADIGGNKVFFERTERLKEKRTYYAGFFTEAQFKGSRSHYKNYDFNQSGKEDGIFPVIVFKNDQGFFEAYVNTSYFGMYPGMGDFSIENEKRLLDFNTVARSVTDRYVRNDENEILSYYRFTTRLDVFKNGQLIKERDKGIVNIGITLAPGDELTPEGDSLRVVGKTNDGRNLYKVGIVGIDYMGHGTHVAGIAAGNYHGNVNAYSSGANKAKIVGITYLGGTYTQSDFIKMIIHLIEQFPNIVFNFSFGSNQLFNEAQSQYALVMDRIAEAYQTPFIKSAGNEGPGINSHGVTASERMITISNYFSTNSRMTFSLGAFPEDKYYLSASSSKGPMIDGTMKPDIGAPGWVLSSLPLSKPMGEEFEKNFEYWPGTSMAAPNATQVVALLYDAAEKAKLGKAKAGAPSITLDKIHTALKNTALPYSSFPFGECLARGLAQKSCPIEYKEKNFEWWEGGAGRINALGSFKVIEKIAHRRPVFYQTKTGSYIDGYFKEANGFFVIDKMIDLIKFDLSLKGGEELEDMNRMEELTLKIPEEIDWLYFDPDFTKKEREVRIFTKTKLSLLLYVDLDKLVENGRIKPGVHQAIVKGYNKKNPEYFEMTFPVTFVGYHSKFDNNMLGDNFKLAAHGFLPAGQAANYYFPIERDSEAVLLDLDVNDPMPGEITMLVYYQGIRLPKELLLSPNMKASALTSIYGEGRGHLTYVLRGLPKGLYEVVLVADKQSYFPNPNNDVKGSYFTLHAGKISLSVEDADFASEGEFGKVFINGANNPGTALTLSHATVYSQKIRMKDRVTIENKKTVTIPIDVNSEMERLKIMTNYFGQAEGTDIDLKLFNAQGEMVASSGNSNSEELIDFKVPAPGIYTLQIYGYEVPLQKDTINLTIEQYLPSPIILTDKWQGPTKEITLTNGFRWRNDRTYSFQTSFPMKGMDKMPQIENYRPVLSTAIDAFYGSDQKTITVFQKDLN